MITLRPYQIQSIELLRESFKKNRRILLVLPTGAGKTLIFAQMVKMAYDKGTRVLVATDRIELFSQTLDAISRHNINPQIITAKTKSFFPDAPVTIAMCETLSRRIKKWKDINYSPNLLICDEAHKGNFFKLLDAFPQASVIGATATPINKKIHLYYTDIINDIDVNELIELGYLCQAKSYQMQDSFDDIPVQRGEFVEKQLFVHFDKKKLYDGCVQKYLEKTPNQKALVYCVNIEHSVKMCEEFNKAGIKSFCITSKTPMNERKKIIKEYTDNQFYVLVNCGCLTHGVDIPEIKVIIMNRATMSLVLFLQCIGRGSRPTPTKKEFTILDFGGNFTRHGLYQTHREWDLNPPKKKKQGVSPVKSCPKCDYMMHASLMKCPECGYIFPKPSHELKNGEMVEIKSWIPEELKGRLISTLGVTELVKLGKSGAVSKPFIWRVVRSKGFQAISDYAWNAGYANGWAFHQQKEINNCKFRDRVL